MLESTEKEYLKRVSAIWSGPLSDYNKVLATNQFTLPVMTYFMWTRVWAITELLLRINRETRKIMVETGAKYPLGFTKLLYLPRNTGEE